MEVEGILGGKMHETGFWIGVDWTCHFRVRWIQWLIMSGLRKDLTSAT